MRAVPRIRAEVEHRRRALEERSRPGVTSGAFLSGGADLDLEWSSMNAACALSHVPRWLAARVECFYIFFSRARTGVASPSHIMVTLA